MMKGEGRRGGEKRAGNWEIERWGDGSGNGKWEIGDRDWATECG